MSSLRLVRNGAPAPTGGRSKSSTAPRQKPRARLCDNPRNSKEKIDDPSADLPVVSPWSVAANSV